MGNFSAMTEEEIMTYFMNHMETNGQYAIAFAIMALKTELAGQLTDIYEMLDGITTQIKVLADNV
jgi:hypothetical protein